MNIPKENFSDDIHFRNFTERDKKKKKLPLSCSTVDLSRNDVSGTGSDASDPVARVRDSRMEAGKYKRAPFSCLPADISGGGWLRLTMI